MHWGGGEDILMEWMESKMRCNTLKSQIQFKPLEGPRKGLMIISHQISEGRKSL